MFKFRDFVHLPQVDPLMQRLVACEPGLMLVAGLDPRPGLMSAASTFLPSGRSTIFRVLIDEILEAHPQSRAIIVTDDKSAWRLPHSQKERVEVFTVRPEVNYGVVTAGAQRAKPDLLVVDRFTIDTAPFILDAAQKGFAVLSQVDSVFRGAAVARQLFDMGAAPEELDALTWVLTIQRMATLCQHCKQPASPLPEQIHAIRRRYPSLHDLIGEEEALLWMRGDLPEPAFAALFQDEPRADAPALKGELGDFYRPESCAHCHGSGRAGDVAAFDIFHHDRDAGSLFDQPSLLPMEAYVLHLASIGLLPLDDFLQFETDQLRRTFALFSASEQELAGAASASQSRVYQLEAANKVMQQRTEALVSLQDMAQALITSTSLDELANRVCRKARDLCGAERAILYYERAPDQIEVLAVAGWASLLAHMPLESGTVLDPTFSAEPRPYNRLPPGIPKRFTGGDQPRAGLMVPLIAQNQRVGMMLVHTMSRSSFAPGAVALLQSFANQAALALQRAGLIEQLRAKIALLEAAQAELVQKERMEREMELARAVQQSVLPKTFPAIPGYRFAALNEPARQVGGDFYDVIDLGDGRFGVAIADVSDKGIPAALYMALTRSLLHAEARRERSPREVAANVNQLLRELGEPDMFVTVFYGVIDRESRTITYTRAGHDNPLLLRGGQATELRGSGVVLGILEQDELHLSEETLALQPGDRLVLYTDGLVDVQDPDGVLYNREALKAAMASYADLPAEELCQAVFDHLTKVRGGAEQYDDMTMLVVEVEET